MVPSSDEWFATETFWESLSPFLFPSTSFASAAEDATRIAALVGVAGGSLVDLACGPGRHAIPFAKAGFRVTGVDLTRSLLARARDYATRERVTLELVEDDLRRFVRPASFDVAVCLFTSFGYYDSARDNALVLQHAFASLAPGGTLVLDVLGKEILARIFQPTTSRETEGRVLVERRNVIDDWTKLDNVWSVLEGTRARSFAFRHWIYSAAELDAMLRAAGFASTRFHGDFAGAPYGAVADRLIAVARRAR